MVPELKVPIDRCGATALMSEQRALYWSDLSFDAVSPEIPYKLNIRQFVCTILSINKTRAEEDVRIRADSWRVCLFLFMEYRGGVTDSEGGRNYVSVKNRSRF